MRDRYYSPSREMMSAAYRGMVGEVRVPEYQRLSIWTNHDGEAVFRLPDGSYYDGPVYGWVAQP